MHIVHTEASQGWGGQEIRILTESRGLLERGHRVTLLTPPGARIFSVAREQGIPVIAMPFEQKRPAGVRALRRWLATSRPDVVNTHSSIDSWLMALTQPFGHRVPVVRTRHISAPLPHSPTTRWLYLKAANHVVTTGERLRRHMIDTLRADAAHFTSVPTGIDLQRYHRTQAAPRAETRAALGIPGDALLVCIAATLRSWKGHGYLLDAFGPFATKRANAHLLIVGDGPMRETIAQQAAASPVAARIHFTGYSERVEDMLAASDIFALPSWANEGVPQAIMQAMALELPVISTPIGAIDEALVDGETGLMVAPKDALSLADALRKLGDDAALRERLGQSGRVRAEARFSAVGMVDAMEHIFTIMARL